MKPKIKEVRWKDDQKIYQRNWARKYREDPVFREKTNKIVMKYRHKLRESVIDMLGGRCVKCGFKDYRALQIDHVNGGGSGKNKDFKSRAELYRSILSGNIKDLQLLCANCNWIKRQEKQEWYKGKND
jgi:hypothetical protein